MSGGRLKELEPSFGCKSPLKADNGDQNAEGARDALYLLRPDSYVALADASGAPDALARYFGDHGIQLGPQSPA